jgi:hypothetical protein
MITNLLHVKDGERSVERRRSDEAISDREPAANSEPTRYVEDLERRARVGTRIFVGSSAAVKGEGDDTVLT